MLLYMVEQFTKNTPNSSTDACPLQHNFAARAKIFGPQTRSLNPKTNLYVRSSKPCSDHNDKFSHCSGEELNHDSTLLALTRISAGADPAALAPHLSAHESS